MDVKKESYACSGPCHRPVISWGRALGYAVIAALSSPLVFGLYLVGLNGFVPPKETRDKEYPELQGRKYISFAFQFDRDRNAVLDKRADVADVDKDGMLSETELVAYLKDTEFNKKPSDILAQNLEFEFHFTPQYHDLFHCIFREDEYARALSLFYSLEYQKRYCSKEKEAWLAEQKRKEDSLWSAAKTRPLDDEDIAYLRNPPEVPECHVGLPNPRLDDFERLADEDNDGKLSLEEAVHFAYPRGIDKDILTWSFHRLPPRISE